MWSWSSLKIFPKMKSQEDFHDVFYGKDFFRTLKVFIVKSFKDKDLGEIIVLDLFFIKSSWDLSKEINKFLTIEIFFVERSSMKIRFTSSKGFDNISSKDFSFGHLISIHSITWQMFISIMDGDHAKNWILWLYRNLVGYFKLFSVRIGIKFFFLFQ